MKDTLSMIVAVIFIVVLLVLLPLYNYFERQDDMSYNLTLKTVTMFVDEVAQNGYIDQNMYDKFIARLATTGNTYDIQIEAKKKILTIDPENIDPDTGEETYIEQFKSYYNKDIFNDETGKTSNIISKDNSLKNNVFFLDVGDKFFVTVKNTNTTMASALLGALVSSTTKEKVNITYGSTIKNNNWENADISQLFQSDILISISLENPNDPEDKNGYPEYNFENATDRSISFIVKVLNADSSENLSQKIKDNIRLVGTNPNCYLNPSSIEGDAGSNNEFKIRFTLDETKQNRYFSDNEYNVFQCFLPANIIQGTFSKNSSASSQKVLYKINSGIEVPEL